MELAKKLLVEAQVAGNVSEGTKFFAVTDKSKIEHPAGSGNMIDVEAPNGPHRVKVLKAEQGRGKSFKGVEHDELQMTILDNGVEKQWNVPVMNEDGNLHYIVEALAGIPDGEEFMVEAFKLKNGKYGKRVSRLAGSKKAEEIPTVQYDEDDAHVAPGTDLGEGMDA
jgi:hypothetical protein